MSAVYPLWREQVGKWLISEIRPSGLKFYLFGVDDTYVPDNSHSTTDDIPEDSVMTSVEELQGVSVTGGIFKAQGAVLNDVLPEVQLKGLVIIAAWLNGNRLVAYIDSESTPSLPSQLLTDRARVEFDPAGIFVI